MTKNSKPDPYSEIAVFVKRARESLGLSQEKLAEALQCTKANVSAWENGRHHPKFAQLSLMSQLSGLSLPNGSPPFYIMRPKSNTQDLTLANNNPLSNASNAHISQYRVVEAGEEDAELGGIKIPYLQAAGSCGGGSLDFSESVKGHLIKESSFFKHFNLNPNSAVVVYADGDSMADFIVDGDIVIFDKSRTKPLSGKIFLINHPDGLRIKQMRREIDGTWVLESRNPDKRRFPDERVPYYQEELISIIGQFVYRQGGYL